MPPRTRGTYPLPSIQRHTNAVNDMVQLAKALDPSRGGSGLAGATPRQLAQLAWALQQVEHPTFTASGTAAILDKGGSLLVSPEARAAAVQLFASAVRALTPFAERTAGNSSSDGQLSSSGGGNAASGGKGYSSRPTDSFGSDGGTAAADYRLVGQRLERLAAVLAACAYLTRCYFLYEIEQEQKDGEKQLSSDWRQTAEALLQGDALAATARLLAADNRRTEGAKLLSINTFIQLQSLANLMLVLSSSDDRVQCGPFFQLLDSSNLLEHSAKEQVERAQNQFMQPASSGRRNRSHGGSTAHKSVDAFTAASFQFLDFVTDNMFDRILCPGAAQPAASAEAIAAARQLLSGRCLQYFTAARAVSQLYAVDGGPLYGLPYDALLPYVTADRQPGERRGQEVLSCGGIHSSCKLWAACFCLCPPEALLPLRPRHLLALCLRTARVALASLGQGRPRAQQEAEEQGQQQQRQGQQDGDGTEPGNMAGDNLGKVSEGQLGGVRWALLGPVGLRRRLEAQGCPGLAVAAMDLASSLLTAKARARGGQGGEDAASGNGSGREGGAGSAGCSGSSEGEGGGSGSGSMTCKGAGGGGGGGGGGGAAGVGCSGSGLGSGDDGGGGSSSVTSNGGGGGGEGGGTTSAGCSGYGERGGSGRGGGEGGGTGGSGTAGIGGPSFWQPHTRCPPLLREPSFADGWWRLALHTVRAALHHDKREQEEKEKEKEKEKEEVDSLVVRSCSLLLPLRLIALESCAMGKVPDQSTIHSLRSALAAGYLPCLEAVLRRHLVPYIVDHEHKKYCSLPTKAPEDLASALCQGPLLQQLLAHGEVRQAAALSVSVAKMLLVTARTAARVVKERDEAGGSSSSSRGDGGGSSGGSPGGSGGSSSGGDGCGSGGGNHGGGDGSSSSRDGGDGRDDPAACCQGWHAARGKWVHALEAVADGAHSTLIMLVSTLVSSSSRQVQGRAKPPFPTAAAELSVAEAAAPTFFSTSGGSSCGAQGTAARDTPPPAASDGKQEEEQLMRLAAFALPRWLQLSVHVIDVCDRLHVAIAGAARPAAGIRHTVRAAAAVVLDACDAAHQAGDGRALGSWRQLLYDIASYGWVRDALDELRPPGRQAAGCWHRRGWEPAGPAHGTQQGAPVVAEGAGAGSGGGVGLALTSEASDGWEDVSASALPPPCEAWRLLPTCYYPLCTNLEEDSEAGLQLRAWGPGAAAGAGVGAGVGQGALEGSGKGGGGICGGGGGAKGTKAGSTDTWQSCDHGRDGGAPLYCSRRCYIAHAVALRTQAAEQEVGKQQKGA